MYRLQITKDYLGFASAHFITFKGTCERLHGHNYQASFEVEGELSDDGYVIDFGDLKRIAKQLCDELDHRVLLATDNPRIEVRRDGDEISAAYNDRRYVFPASDVALLPISNTTAELLATYLADRMIERLRDHADAHLHAIGVSVSEGPGQSAYVRKPLH
jgi:6-pyruvoyltetrahydropterin/6-carboxytetrahydropterin synthase